MQISYAARRAAFYPWEGGTGWELPPPEVRQAYLRKVREIGLAGVEVGVGQGIGTTEQELRELRRELEDAGVPCTAVRAGGGFTNPVAYTRSRDRLEQAIRTASWIGSNLVNTALTTPPRDPRGLGASGVGERVAQGSSREATEADFELTARAFREAAALAADLGVQISIELHQHSIADNSWSCLKLLDLIDRPNVGLNPDLGNLYWQYDEPEETPEQAIKVLASRANYWHCKQLQRVHIPDLERSIFLAVPLPDGDIDYRFAIGAMLEANYTGFLAIEGIRFGDQLSADHRSADYCRSIIQELAG
jgi:sugar phosphate isomerase/epimerase